MKQATWDVSIRGLGDSVAAASIIPRRIFKGKTGKQTWCWDDGTAASAPTGDDVRLLDGGRSGSLAVIPLDGYEYADALKTTGSL